MKKIIIILLCSSVLFNGCYSYYSISDDYKGEPPPPDENIRVYLEDDSVIESKAYQHIYNPFTSNLYYGEYWDINKRTGIREEMTGWLSEITLDSCHYSEFRDSKLFTCYKGNDNEFIFTNLMHQLNDAEGFYAAYNYGKDFYGPIGISEIKDIKVEELNVVSTVLVGAGAAAAAFLLIGLILWLVDPPFKK